jgi:ADP-heptose:LPS heptosyltransferase
VTFPKLDFKKDLDDWLAIAAACDGILSVSTALVHFAGACGQRVGVIMPEPQGPWILGTDDEWHLTYPEVHIFRRNTGESVKQLIDRVSGAILS